MGLQGAYGVHYYRTLGGVRPVEAFTDASSGELIAPLRDCKDWTDGEIEAAARRLGLTAPIKASLSTTRKRQFTDVASLPSINLDEGNSIYLSICSKRCVLFIWLCSTCWEGAGVYLPRICSQTRGILVGFCICRPVLPADTRDGGHTPEEATMAGRACISLVYCRQRHQVKVNSGHFLFHTVALCCLDGIFALSSLLKPHICAGVRLMSSPAKSFHGRCSQSSCRWMASAALPE